MVIFGIFIILLLVFLIMTVVNKKPEDPSNRKWSNRTEEGNRWINKIIADGWEYTHDRDGRFAYYKNNMEDNC